MNEENEKYTLEEAHLKFAKMLNGKTWELLENQNRTQLDDEIMVHAAHGSLFHWLQVGGKVNHQRGEYMIAKAYTALSMGESAKRHANRCLQLTEEYKDQMADFDMAFAYECAARAHAAAGDEEKTLKYFQLAQEAGKKIADTKDKEIWDADFAGGEWFGFK